MILQIVAGFACLAAALAQYATHRTPSVIDPPHVKNARMIMIVALLVTGMSLLGEGLAGHAQPLLALVGGLMALSQIIFAFNNLVEAGWWKSPLHSSS